MNDIRVLFMGTPDFALESCKRLYEKYNLVGVVTQPDRPKGRGNKLVAPPVKEYAIANNIPCWQPLILKDGAFLDVLNEAAPDLIVVAAYGRILPEYILNYPKYGCINVHGSLLPKYRGAAPIQRCVINGEDETGVTIMKMAKGMDTGDIILQRVMKLGEKETAGTLFDRMAAVGADVLIEAVELILKGKAVYKQQNEDEATYAPMIQKSEGAIDFSLPAARLRNLIMGMNPSPGAFYEANEIRIKLHEASVGGETNATPGIITAIEPNGISIAAGDGKCLIIETLQKPGKTKMSAYSYAMGAKLAVGETLK